MQHWVVVVGVGVVVAGVEVRVCVRMVDVVDVGVAACALCVQVVGPAVGEVSRRRQAGLGEHVAGPQGPVRVTEGNRAGGEVRVDRDGDRREARTGLLWIRGGVPN